MQHLSSTLHPQSYAPTCEHFTELKVGWFYYSHPPTHPPCQFHQEMYTCALFTST